MTVASGSQRCVFGLADGVMLHGDASLQNSYGFDRGSYFI